MGVSDPELANYAKAQTKEGRCCTCGFLSRRIRPEPPSGATPGWGFFEVGYVQRSDPHRLFLFMPLACFKAIANLQMEIRREDAGDLPGNPARPPLRALDSLQARRRTARAFCGALKAARHVVGIVRSLRKTLAVLASRGTHATYENNQGAAHRRCRLDPVDIAGQPCR